jgi:hypothetical protein
MNWQFYDFWGNFLLQVAKGQKQVDDMANWMRQGFDALNDMGALFRNSYGLPDASSDAGITSSDWQQAVYSFQKSLDHFAGQWGWVSQAEYQKSRKECENLRTKVESQKETIEQLRDLLAQKGMGHAELFKHVQDSLNEQSHQFHELMRSIGGTDKEKA